MTKRKNALLSYKPRYIITPAMNNLVKAFRDCGYKVEINSNSQYCYDMEGQFNYIRYCTEITIDEYTSDGDNYEFIFTPDGKRISDYHFNEEYCIRE